MNEIKVGSVVQLNHGGRLMTVLGVDGVTARCWNGVFSDFPIECLHLVKAGSLTKREIRLLSYDFPIQVKR